jgi:DNA replication protein DnaC
MAQHMASNLITLVSASMMNHLKTENIILDIALSIFFILVIHECMANNFTSLKKCWNWILRKDKQEIYEYKIECMFIKTEGGFRAYYTNTYLALIDDIINKGLIIGYHERCFSEYTKDGIKIPKDASFDISNDIHCKIRNITEGDHNCGLNITLSSKKSLTCISDYCENAIKNYNDRMEFVVKNNQFYFSPHFEEKKIKWVDYKYKTNKTWNHLFFDDKENIISQINKFCEHPEIYKEQGIPWTLGILLYGKPGTGKTSFIKALTSQTKRHLIEVPLNEIKTYEQLKQIFLDEKILKLRIPFDKRIYLIEDIDCLNENLVKKRDSAENMFSIDNKDLNNKEKEKTWKDKSIFSKNQDITLSHLLNIIDGPIEIPGRILIMTSNHPEKIDPALLREGRIDIKIKMKFLQGEPLKEMIQKWYPEKNLEDKSFTNKCKYTPAQVENLCLTKTFEEVCEYVK